MTRHGGRYYLQYSAAGAEWRNYSVGCYVADHPLGPFTPQKRNPVLIQRGGMINGCGHNSIVEDEQGRLWCFYTILMRRFRGLERRIGMDPVRFDENGELYVDGPSETPVRIDGTPTGRLLLSAGQPVEASSFRTDHEPDLALDNYIRTYYEAAPEDPAPTLTVDLLGKFDVAAVRVIFHEKLTPHEVLPARFQFLVEGTLDGETWLPLADCRGKTFDGHIRYETFEPRSVVKVRLTVTGTPGGQPAGVVDFAVFGNASEAGYRGEPR